MPIGTLGTIALAAGPSLAGGITQLLAGAPPKSAYEKELGRLSKYFGEQYKNAQTDPLSTDSAQAKVNIADRVYDKRSKNLASQSATTGATDEAKLAGQGQLNESYNGVINNILAGADRDKQQLLSQFLSTSSAGEQMRTQAINDRKNKVSSIFGPLQKAASGYLISNALGAEAGGGEEAKKKTSVKDDPAATIYDF